VNQSGDDPAVLYRPDDYARPFLPVGEQLAALAADALSNSKPDQARNLYLRSAAVFRIARFPINRSKLGQEAWRLGKAAYEEGGKLLDPPSVSVSEPFTHSDVDAGDLERPIEAYLRLPNGDRPASGWPVLLFICGLDAYRTDHTPRTQQHVDRGFATLSFEIPGTGDCPAAPNDPAAPDRLMSSIIDWVEENFSRYAFDTQKIVARGISTGGYYAFRVAHTHAKRLFAVVAQGGGCHHTFDPDWIRAQDQMEYPFALAEALAWKFGYRDSDGAVAIAR
jgi:dipeptidyl aminopeptidase/acylaminoacyl peptidase